VRRLLFAVAVAATVACLGACRRKGNATVGDKRAFTCAEVERKDSHEEIDLGSGKKLVRDGVRAELRGAAADAPVLVTSIDGGVSRLDPQNAALVVVVGLGALDRPTLSSALGALAKNGALVVAVAGPQDDVEIVRGAIVDAGAHVVDGGVVRAIVHAGIELVTLPGSDDPHSLAEHGRGCVLRADDLAALVGKLGRVGAGRARIVASYSAQKLDAIPDVSAWLVAGPYDFDAPEDVRLAAGMPPVRIAIPRMRVARTTSIPATIPAGGALVRIKDSALAISRVEATGSSTSAP